MNCQNTNDALLQPVDQSPFAKADIRFCMLVGVMRQACRVRMEAVAQHCRLSTMKSKEKRREENEAQPQHVFGGADTPG